MDGIKVEVTDYVAVIATMPPAAPAREWIAESPGIVESCSKYEGDAKRMWRGLSFVHRLKHVTSDSTADVLPVFDREVQEKFGRTRLYNISTMVVVL